MKTTDERTQNDETYAVTVLRPLRGIPVRPSTVNVSRAVAEGRRRMRMRWYSGGVAVAALTATAVAGGPLAVAALNGPGPAPTATATGTPATGTPATGTPASAGPGTPATAAGVPARPAPANCTVTRLPTDGIDKAVVTGGDPSGRLLVGRTYPGAGESYPLVIWRDGTLATKTEMPGADQSFEDINAAGVAVGHSYAASGDNPARHPYVYQDGKVRRLAGGPGGATAINDAGVIVGTLDHKVGDFYDGVPARWASAGAEPVKLALPPGATFGNAVDIDADGTIVGHVFRDIREAGAAHLWLPDGTDRKIGAPKLPDGQTGEFQPTAIRNGRIVGTLRVNSPDDKGTASKQEATRESAGFRVLPYRYDIATGHFERLPAGAGPVAAISADGWVLTDGTPPMIVAGTASITLPAYDKLGKAPGYQMVNLSDDGRTAAGHGWGETVENQPLTWRCE